MNHPTKIFRRSPQTIGRAIGRMRFDAMAELLLALATELHEQGLGDVQAKRFKLYRQVYAAAMSIKHARVSIQEAWRISEPFMKKSKDAKR